MVVIAFILALMRKSSPSLVTHGILGVVTMAGVIVQVVWGALRPHEGEGLRE